MKESLAGDIFWLLEGRRAALRVDLKGSLGGSGFLRGS